MSYDFQQEFAQALTAPGGAPPPGVATREGASRARRFAVYRDNARQSLIDALASSFPATQALVGRAFFAAMAHAFASAHPPRSPLLLAYGGAFPAFVEAFEPARGLPYLADVARIEWARVTAYHAADAAPLAAPALALLAPAELQGLRLRLHPAASALASAHSAVSIWAINAGDATPETLEACEGEDCLVTRPRLTVSVHRLAPGDCAFLKALDAGLTLADAAERGDDAAPRFDLPRALTTALQAGAFSSFETTREF